MMFRLSLFAFFFYSALVLNSVADWAFSQDESADAGVDREQTIYIPYDKLRDVFEKEGRGVFVPYEQFQRLWQAARKAESDPALHPPPVDSIIMEVNSEATVRRDVVQVVATLNIELLKDGWNRVPLRLNGAAIQAATIDGRPARVVSTDNGYELIVNKRGESQNVTLELTYVKAISKSPGRNQVTFAAPRAPLNRWKIRIPQPGVKVEVNPMIAATSVDGAPSNSEDSESAVSNEEQTETAEEPSDPGTDADVAVSGEQDEEESETGEAGDQETVLLAFVGSAPTIEISWTPKAEGASGLAALTSVQTLEQIFVSEGAIRSRAKLDYSISRAPMQSLVIEVPADYKVVNVFDPNVRKWDIQASNDTSDTQLIEILLFEPVSKAQPINLELERFAPEDGFEEIELPRVRAVGVGRQQGSLVVDVAANLRSEVRQREGVSQVDTSDLPTGLPSQNWDFAFRYAAVPYTLSLAVEKLQPRISVEQESVATLAPERLTLDVRTVYDIAQAGVFQLEFTIPADFEVLEVRGAAADDATPAQVDTFYMDGTDEVRLIVNLSRQALGKTGLEFRLSKQIDEANLQAPTGQASTLSLPLAVSSQDYVEELSGRLTVRAPESLRVTPTTTQGMRATAVTETQIVNRDDGTLPTRPVLSYIYSNQPTQLDLSVERRSPHIAATQVLAVRVEPGVVKYRLHILFEIRYSGVASIRVDVPQEFESAIRLVDSKLRDAPLTPIPDDVQDGYVAWALAADTELIGSHNATLTWEQQTPELPIGQSAEISIPRVVPQGVDRAWGQIVLAKAEAIDVQPSDDWSGLRSIDPNYDVIPNGRLADAALAFEFQDDWSLDLNTTRYEAQQLKHTSIERGLINAVVTRSQHTNFQALFRVRSARQRIAIQLPSGTEFSTQPARINGRPVALERGDQDLLYVPLIDADSNSEFVLELRYGVPGDHKQLDVPSFPEVPAIQKVYLAAYLPEEMSLVHSSGPWTDEFSWRRADGLEWNAKNNRSADELQKWVREGVEQSASPAYQTAGEPLLFSTMRPGQPPNNSLRLTCIHQNTIAGIVITLISVMGLVLLRANMVRKLTALAMVLIIAVLCGVMAPTLGHQLLNLPTIAAMAIVGIAWGTHAFSRVLRPVSSQPANARQQISVADAKALTSSTAEDVSNKSDIEQSEASVKQIDTPESTEDRGSQASTGEKERDSDDDSSDGGRPGKSQGGDTDV